MLRFVVRRLLLLIPILIGLSILLFLWIRALPGSPATALLGERATAEQIEAINEHSVSTIRSGSSTGRTSGTCSSSTSATRSRRGGRSPTSSSSASRHDRAGARGDVLLDRRRDPAGFLAAKRYGSFFDHFSLFASLLGISIPIFVLAIILKYIFAVRLGWLPTVGRISVLIDLETPTNFYVLDAIIARTWAALWDVIKHLILPAIALGTIPLAIITRITRAAVLDVQNEDYVRTARAKGVAPRTVDGRHILRNAMLPIVTIIGLQVGLLLSGAVLTETVFAWPGIGTWLLAAIEARDYAVLQGGILIIAIVFVIVNLSSTSRTASSTRGSGSRERRRDRGQEAALEPGSGGLWRDAWARLRRDRGALLGFALVGCSSSSPSSRRCSHRKIRASRISRGSAAAAALARRSTTGSASTPSDETSSRASSTAPATRC